MDRCLVVQGPTISKNVSNIKKYWNNIPIVFSTWEGSDKTNYSDEDIVIYNKYPNQYGKKNLNLQLFSSINGFLKAKELGFKRVIKWRQDMYPSNSNSLLELFKLDSINFYAFMQHEHGYVTDYFMEGSVDEMIELFNITNVNVPYPEYAFTQRVFELNLDKKINFVCNDLNEENDIFWISKNLWLSTNKKINRFTNKIV